LPPAMKSIPSLIAALALAASGSVAFAQNATTTPVGAVSVQLDANNRTALSIPLDKEITYIGKVSAVTSTTLSDSSANFSNLANTHCVRMTSGNARGRVLKITDSTATTLTVSTGTGQWNLPVDNSSSNAANVAVDDTFQILPMWTVSELFGSSSADCILRTSSNPNSADQITFYIDGTILTLFNNGTNWRNAANVSDTTNYNTYGISPSAGMWVLRRSTGSNATLDFVGTVPMVPQRFQIPGSSRSIQPIPYAANASLGSLAFAASSNWVKNNNPNNADQVTIYRPDKTFNTYFVNASGVWRNAQNAGDATDYSSVAIPSGSGMWIVRRGSASGSAANFASTLPYNIQ